MNKNEMKAELNNNNVIDNPFDVMLYHSLELTRELMFACRRLRNPEIPEIICTNKDKINNRVENIMCEYSKLMNMSDETIALCRETSSYYKDPKFSKMNDELLKLENELNTVYDKINPSRNDKFERVKLGEESDEYKRLIELRFIISDSDKLSNFSDSYLRSLCDVISSPEECVPNWMTQEEFDKKNKIVKEYNLTENDVEYMISYRNWRKNN